LEFTCAMARDELDFRWEAWTGEFSLLSREEAIHSTVPPDTYQGNDIMLLCGKG